MNNKMLLGDNNGEDQLLENARVDLGLETED